MEAIEIGGNVLLCAPEATRAAYRSFTPDLCGCSGCRNYRKARSVVYKESALKFFGQFGIDPSKEAEIYTLGPVATTPNLMQYGGWFHFIGEIAKCGDRVEIGENLIIWFSNRPALAPPSFAGQTLVQVELEAAVPWLLPEPWESDPHH